MDLQLPTAGLDNYKSASQRARICTESWGAASLYCPACDSRRIDALPSGTHAADFTCPSCESRFQLKSKSSAFGNRVIDGAYVAMHRAIVGDETPNLFLLHYQLPKLTVESVLLIPHFAFTLSLLEKRKPLSPNARRAGWVGCNFLLDRIPADARIPIIQDGQLVSSAKVRKAYKRLRPLEKLNVQKRGWTLDVLQIVKRLNKEEFTLREVYNQEESLVKLHPNNAHVRDKIRQQLQILRDLDLIEFLTPGSYRLK
ncbi:MAG TPA: DpnI domain-containing protein [Candidatus Acidoferrum sp.]|nr:DpnI domain-containing protein [Candidatus Acidoferrum sp.]